MYEVPYVLVVTAMDFYHKPISDMDNQEEDIQASDTCSSLIVQHNRSDSVIMWPTIIDIQWCHMHYTSSFLP
jgi:hypothetical protein